MRPPTTTSFMQGEHVPLRARITHNGMWPLLPILAWNVALGPRLPAAFLDDTAVPSALLMAEGIGRVFTFGAPLVLVLGRGSEWQRRGLALFVVGTVAYLVSWLPPLLDAAPSWLWLGPYLLPALWLVGLGLMARSRGYIVGALLFVAAHVSHGVFVLCRALC